MIRRGGDDTEGALRRLVRDIRNLNRRTARLEHFALLVSVDSLTLLLPLANDPLGHRADRSPLGHKVPLVGMTAVSERQGFLHTGIKEP